MSEVKKPKLIPIFFLICLSACSAINQQAGLDLPDSQMGETATGAVTGAALGAGLGLLIGSTSGEAGQGMLVGSLAGAALGAGVGAKLEKDSEGESIAARKAEVYKQGEQIRQQDIELKSLKKKSSDDIYSYDAPIRQPKLDYSKEYDIPRGAGRQKTARDVVSEKAEIKTPAKSPSARGSLASKYLSKPSGSRRSSPYSENPYSENRDTLTSVVKGSAVSKKPAVARTKSDFLASEKSLPAEKIIKETKEDKTAIIELPSVKEEVVAKKEEIKSEAKQLAGVVEKLPPAASAAVQAVKTEAVAKLSGEKSVKELADCKDAIKEAERGLQAGSDADRLFYLRRAARLCPTEPSYHVELGKLYSEIGKHDEAKQELKQAIEIDPNNQVARDELSIVENSKSSH